ncbi:hypothetical protein SEMRO_2179_G317930.1 [Seminavis robusta]|uniref:Uncharacterized protein n=1 Tax=Seminavis robusta TaxID=568900 RepID=A0A9N8F0Q6_9STRA|nr:hypothetical protein SEMRO_2179_G317930.1 [Seminavis robusta]|eukprot:Sro2179_g317930.1 n/a (300) ;mRNA; f:15068-15967
MNDCDLYDLVVNNRGGWAKNQVKMLAGYPQDNDQEHHYLFTVYFASNNGRKAAADTFARLLDSGVGLVGAFNVHPPFKTVQKVDHPGFYVFDGDATVTPKFMSLDQPVQNESCFMGLGHLFKGRDHYEVQRLKRVWENQQLLTGSLNSAGMSQSVVNHTGDQQSLTNLRNAQVFHPTPPHLQRPTTANMFTAWLPQPQPQQQPLHSVHSMVLLGGYKADDGKEFFLIQNSWENMPLILASTKYLNACGAVVYFLKDKLGQLPNYTRKAEPVTSCSLPGRSKNSPHRFAPWAPRKNVRRL